MSKIAKTLKTEDDCFMFKVDEACEWSRRYFDEGDTKKARKYLSEAKKIYRNKIRQKASYSYLDQNIAFLDLRIGKYEDIEQHLNRIYDAVDADKMDDARSAVNACNNLFLKYMQEGHIRSEKQEQKFQSKINSALAYIEANKWNCLATAHLTNAKEFAKVNKFDEALKELNEAEGLATLMKTMNLISAERIKIQQDRDRQNEAAENKRLDDAARGILNTISYKNNSALFQVTTKKYEEAASLASNKTLKDDIKKEKGFFLDYAIPYCINEAKELVKANKFEEANSKFDEASCMARDALCPRKHLDDLEKEIRSAYNARAQYLQKIANDFVKEKKVKEAEEKFEEALCFAKEESIINLIKADKSKTDKDMEAIQIDNKRAALMLESAQVHAMKNEFQLAKQELQIASVSANDEALKEKIEKEAASINTKHVKYLQKEANDLLNQNKLKESINKFKEAVSIVTDKSLRKSVKADKSKAVKQYMKLLLKQANELADQNKFKEAYDKIEEALNFNEEDTSTALDCKAMTKNKEGMFCLKESFKLESSEPFTEIKCKEAKEKLDRAHELFKEAEERTKTKQQKNINIVEAKIHGNKCFNDAVLMEGKAFDIYEDAKIYKNLPDYTSVQEKYQKAKDLYEKAKEHFTNGFKLGCEEFQTSINLASDQISNIPKIITSIDTLKLKCKFDKKRQMKPVFN